MFALRRRQGGGAPGPIRLEVGDSNAAPGEEYGVKNLFQVVAKQLTLQGFLLHRWKDRHAEGRAQLAAWLREGKLRHNETIVDGFEGAAGAMVSLLRGGNTGKLVVRVEEPGAGTSAAGT